jgi:DNA-binding NarL/FixJ family response regulator
MSMTPNILEAGHLIEMPNDRAACSCRNRDVVMPLGRAMLIGRPCLILECLRDAMNLRGIKTNASPLEQCNPVCAIEYDVFVIFLMRFEPGVLSLVKERVNAFRSYAPRVPTAALIEDPDATEAAAFSDIGFTTVVLGLPSVPFAVDVINLLLLSSRHVRELARVEELHGPMEKGREPGFSATNVCFTSRELELLDLLRHGMQNKRIAYELGISQSTVKAHLRSIMIKLKAKNRTEAACMLTQEPDRAKEIVHG